MTIQKNLNVLELSEKVHHDSQSGDLARKILSEGQTLYGIESDSPDFMERITPDGCITLGHWCDGEFDAVMCLLRHIDVPK